MAQAPHGSAPDIVGKNIANPMGIMLSTVMYLDWLAGRLDDPELNQLVRHTESSIMTTVAEGICTRDLGGSASTSEFAAAIVERTKRTCQNA